LAVGNVMDNEGSLFTVALLPGLIFVGIGGLTIFTLPGRRQKKHWSHRHWAASRPFHSNNRRP